MPNNPAFIQSMNQVRGALSRGSATTEAKAISLTSSGLLLFDDFDTAGVQNTVGNGWSEEEVAADDLRTFDGDSTTPGLDHNDQDNLTHILWRDMAELGIDTARGFMVEFHGQVRATTDNSQIGIRGYWDQVADDWYDVLLRDTFNRLEAREVEGGSLTQNDAGNYTDGVGRPNAYKVRAKFDKSGANPVVTGYEFSGAPHSASVFKQGAATQRVQITDTGGDIAGDDLAFAMHDKTGLYLVMVHKDWVVKVTGLPTGWKAQLDTETAVVESGGTATIDVSTVELPGVTIKVLDDGDVEQATLTPSNVSGRRGAELTGGIVGGDIFAYG